MPAEPPQCGARRREGVALSTVTFGRAVSVGGVSGSPLRSRVAVRHSRADRRGHGPNGAFRFETLFGIRGEHTGLPRNPEGCSEDATALFARVLSGRLEGARLSFFAPVRVDPGRKRRSPWVSFRVLEPVPRSLSLGLPRGGATRSARALRVESAGLPRDDPRPVVRYVSRTPPHRPERAVPSRPERAPGGAPGTYWLYRRSDPSLGKSSPQ